MKQQHFRAQGRSEWDYDDVFSLISRKRELGHDTHSNPPLDELP